MNRPTEIEVLLAGFKAASARRGEFVQMVVRPDGTVRASWHDYAEEFTPDQLRTLLELYRAGGTG